MDELIRKDDVEVIPGVVDLGRLSAAYRRNTLAFLQRVVDTDEHDPHVVGQWCRDMLMQEYLDHYRNVDGKEPTKEEIYAYNHSREFRASWQDLMEVANEVNADNFPGFIKYLEEKDREVKKNLGFEN